jgi:diguanylate cyclase (GGDEF)-like protein
LSILVWVVMVSMMVGLGWWAAARIDARLAERQTRFVSLGLTEIAERTIVEQDSSAIWDDAVLNLRIQKDAWIAENLAEWVSSYFGHDEVYLLDARDSPVRAVSQGKRVPDIAYDKNRDAIGALVAELREQMSQASAGLADSTEAITGLGVIDRVLMNDGGAAIISVRPIVPGTDAVQQAPGTEFLHVSVRRIDADVDQIIAKKYGLEHFHFDRVGVVHPDHISAPVLNNSGRILGYFSWLPYRPALQLLLETAPIVVGSLLAGGLVVGTLMLRLRRTSARLEMSEANATFLAFHDPLTRIPNRALFADRFERALAGRRHKASRLAVHSIDLDRFKSVNDTLGHPAGDELLRQVAGRLNGAIGTLDTVARLGGDEFAVLQVEIGDVSEALRVSAAIVEACERPFDIHGQQVIISASVGVVYVQSDELSSDDLMRQADIALYEAKAGGRGRYQLFVGELDISLRDRRALELELRAAIDGEPGLELVYQPIYAAGSLRIVGSEALVRWENPRRGRLSPDVFVGLAEERGLIDELGLWVLREACHYAAGSSVPWVAVNVSPLQFQNEQFVARVLETLRDSGLSPKRLEIEITEGLLLQNSPKVQERLRRLRASGIRIALDDFGTGYSSISYLRTHGVDKLKIDQSFIAGLGQDLEIEHITRSIIQLAHAMDIHVTADGVETEEQQRILRDMACDQLQGYLLSRPVTPTKLQSLVSDQLTIAGEVAA